MIYAHKKTKEVFLLKTRGKRKSILYKVDEEGNKIIDTHGGSFTNAIACDMEGYDLDIIEIDETYFDNGVQAFDKYKQQLKLF